MNIEEDISSFVRSYYWLIMVATLMYVIEDPDEKCPCQRNQVFKLPPTV